ncbi:MAG: hypothetical protein ACOH12_05535 [Parvibaculaceae bacterium]
MAFLTSRQRKILDMSLDFRDRLEDVAKVKFSEFLQHPKWGETNFEALVDDFEKRLRPIIDLLLRSDLTIFNEAELTQLSEYFHSILNSLENISSFSIGKDGAIPRRQELIVKASENIRSFETLVGKYAYQLSLHEDVSKKYSDEMESIIQQMKISLLDSIASRETAEEVKKEIDAVLTSVRKAAPEVGVSAQAEIFQKQSRKYFISSLAWLAATTISTAASICVAWHFYLHPQYLMGDLSLAIQVVVVKIMIITMLVSTTVWCGKNYRALAHETSVNRHRSNSLSTFRTFVEATSEADIRNAVLLEATKTIFSHAASGYLDKGDSSGADTRILEVVRAASSVSRSHTG